MAVAIAAQELKDAKEKRDDLNYKRVNQYMLEGIQAQLTMAEQAVDDAEDRLQLCPGSNPKMTLIGPKRWPIFLRPVWHVTRSNAIWNTQKDPPTSQDIAEADARVSKAEAALEDARRTYDRRKTGPDPKDLELAEANLKNAEAQAEAARAVLSDLELTAPFDGTIIVNNLEVGEMAAAGQVMIGDTSAWQVETTDLKEVDIVGIQSGMPVKVRFDAIPDLEIKGIVNRVKGYGITVRGDNTYTVTIDLQQADPRLLWNMTARVIFPAVTAP